MNKTAIDSTLKKAAASSLSALLALSAPGLSRAATVSLEIAGVDAPAAGAPAVAGASGPLAAPLASLGAGAALQAAPAAMSPSAAVLAAPAQAIPAASAAPAPAVEAAPVAAARQSEVLATASNPEVRQIVQGAARGAAAGDVAASAAASSVVFDQAARTKAGVVEAVSGTAGSGRARLARGAPIAAAALVVAAPRMAHALDMNGGISSDVHYGPILLAGAIVFAVVAAGKAVVKSFQRVARTLDAEPSPEQIAAYERAEAILSLNRVEEHFNGERLWPAGTRQAARKEIEKMTGMKADDAVAAAIEIISSFRREFAAYRHPLMAKAARAFAGRSGAK